MKNVEIFNLYQKLKQFESCTTAYSITVNAAKTKNLRALKPYVEDYAKLHNEIIDKHSKALNEADKQNELAKLCEAEFKELDNIEFSEVDALLSRIELSELPQDIPPREYALLEDIINL